MSRGFAVNKIILAGREGGGGESQGQVSTTLVGSVELKVLHLVEKNFCAASELQIIGLQGEEKMEEGGDW